MPAITFYFQVHQPYRVRSYRVFDIGHDHNYFTEGEGSPRDNEAILRKVAGKCYLPMNALLLELLERHPEFRVSFSFSGTFLRQCEAWMPEVLDSFRALIATGRVEVLDETDEHSLAVLKSQDEFVRQIALHRERVRRLFGVIPTAFRNTELIYRNDLAKIVRDLGYTSVIAEGADRVLGWRSPDFLYTAPGAEGIAVHLKNYRLSDDIAFRFSSREWKEWPLTVEKFVGWVNGIHGNGDVLNLFMDYETFGEHQWADTGIFDFMRALPGEVLKHPDNSFATVSEAAKRFPPQHAVDIPDWTSWADTDRDLSAWLGNPMQDEAFEQIFAMEADALATKDPKIIQDWRDLTTSDHFYYMCTKWFSDGDVHKYFNPYATPYDAAIAYRNVCEDLRLRIREAHAHKKGSAE